MRVRKIGDFPNGIEKAEKEKHAIQLIRARERGRVRGVCHITQGLITVNGVKFRTGDVLLFDDGEWAVAEAIATTEITMILKEGEISGYEAKDTFKRNKKG